jgi:hypothetical protein
MAEDTAREIPNLPLEDALQLVHLHADRGSPKLEPAARQFAPHDACPSRSGRGRDGLPTADPLSLREVLRGTGQQVDLQGLLQPRGELNSRPDGDAEVLCGAVLGNKNPDFRGFSSY